MVFKYILFRKLHFCRFMHSLGKNEKYSYVRNAYCAITKEMAFRVTRIVTLKTIPAHASLVTLKLQCVTGP